MKMSAKCSLGSTRDLRILWWIDHLGTGGSQRALADLVVCMTEMVDHQAVVVLNDVVDPKVLARLTSAGVDVYVLGKLKLITLVGLVELWRLVKKRNYNLSVCMLFWADCVGNVLSRICGIPIISSQRSNNQNYSRVKRIILRGVLRLSERIVLNARSYQSDVTRWYLPRGADVRIIPNGLELGLYSERKTKIECRKAFGINSNLTVLGSMGRISEEKGLPDLIRAFALLGDKTAQLLIAGAGPQRATLEKLADRLGVASCTIFLGHLDSNHDDFFGSLDVYVQPSIFEGMPMALLEAMASGCPVIGTEVGGVPDLIRNGKTGWLVPPRNPRALSTAISQALEHPDLASDLAENARSMVSNAYSLDTVAGDWRELLLEVAGVEYTH
jgi:glycosyltransferase involved in cell wall biosynthesis